MKKISIVLCSAVFALSGCMTTGTNTGTAANGSILGNVLGTVLSSAANTGTLTNILFGIIGANTLTEETIVGTWNYKAPGCAFTSENALAKAGGQVVSATVVEKMQPTYNTLGIKSGNTKFTFNADKSFSATIGGKPINGTYTYNPSTGAIALKTLLLNANGYLTRTANGMSLTFESKKLLSALQLIGGMSGNQTLSTVSEISKNYDGIRLGFDLTK
ncbi:MAG: DUF4923 family protein [Prevotella sp.]|nr:DUF4923 family protein [Prevotella sp.]